MACLHVNVDDHDLPRDKMLLSSEDDRNHDAKMTKEYEDKILKSGDSKSSAANKQKVVGKELHIQDLTEASIGKRQLKWKYEKGNRPDISAPEGNRVDKASSTNLNGCSIEGFQCLDYRSFTVIGEKDSVQLLSCPEAGYQINFPPNSVNQTVEVKIAAAMTGLFEFPENTSPVSAIVHVESGHNLALMKPATLELKHCCDVETEEQASNLSFACAHVNGVFPYRFESVLGGRFPCTQQHGTIAVSEFSLWCIVRAINAVYRWIARHLPWERSSDNEQSPLESDTDNDQHLSESDPGSLDLGSDIGQPPSESDPILLEPDSHYGRPPSESDPILSKPDSDYGRPPSESDPILSEPDSRYGRPPSESDPILSEPDSRYGRPPSESDPILSEPDSRYGRPPSESDPILSEPDSRYDRPPSESDPILSEPDSRYGQPPSESDPILSEPDSRYGQPPSESDPILSEPDSRYGQPPSESDPILSEPDSDYGQPPSESDPILSEPDSRYGRPPSESDPILSEPDSRYGQPPSESDPILSEPDSDYGQPPSESDPILSEPDSRYSQPPSESDSCSSDPDSYYLERYFVNSLSITAPPTNRSNHRAPQQPTPASSNQHCHREIKQTPFTGPSRSDHVRTLQLPRSATTNLHTGMQQPTNYKRDRLMFLLEKLKSAQSKDVDLPRKRYVSFLFYSCLWGSTCKLKLILSVVQDLPLCRNTLTGHYLSSKMRYKQYGSILVNFDNEKREKKICVKRVNVRGWEFRRTGSSEIWQNEVDNVDGSDRSVLSRCTIELILFAVNTRDPVMLDYRMELHGTKPLRDYNIVFDPFDSVEEWERLLAQPQPVAGSRAAPTFAEIVSRAGVTRDLLDTEVALEHFLQIASSFPNWYHYAKALQISDMEIQDIANTPGWTAHLKAYRVLELWHQANTFKATYRCLIEVCLEQGHATLATKICLILKGWLGLRPETMMY